MKTFPTLYKKTNTGAIQRWDICVDGASITTTYGQVDGKLQTTTDIIKEGKNIGKANATTCEQQALSEGQSKWDKQKKKRYHESYEAACNGEVDETVIQGGIPPMLSINKSHPKDPILKKYLKFPCIIQPKLDGSRCIAIVEDGKATLWTRTQKPIHCVPHIVEELERRFPKGKIVLDGELYVHEYADRFQDLMSIIRQDEPDGEGLYKVMQLHVYDCLESSEYETNLKTYYKDRMAVYDSLIRRGGEGCVVSVEGFICENEAQLLSQYEKFLGEGYEGGMAKNSYAEYESGKRSSNILKMKEFSEAEAIIIGMEEGKGRDMGVAAKFVCKMPDSGKEFKARMKCSQAQKREYYINKEKYIGKALTYTYKRLTDDGKPYIPVGKTIRDYE